MSHRERPLLAVQFHPEVVHTRQGNEILSNFVFRICGCERDWNPTDRIAPIEQQIRQAAGDRNVFFFVSNNQGGHIFATTLAEHQRNVARYRRQVAALGRGARGPEQNREMRAR